MPSTPPNAGGLRRTTRLGGAWQMACDDWLLDQGRPAFRLYHWSRPTLSLGYHQRRIPAHWLELARSGAVALVRRPSGGSAVLHGAGITYALVWPDPPGERPQAYRQACRWLQLAFAELGLPLQFGGRPAGLSAAQGANCFARHTAADLGHGSGCKRIGSAQLWRRGQLLQHGEILLDPPQELWLHLFAAPAPPLPPLPLGATDLEHHLLDAASRALPAGLRQAIHGHQPLAWRAEELAAIASRLGRYRLEPDTALALASPEATMERTTWGSARPRG